MNEHHAWLSTHLGNFLLPIVLVLGLAMLVLWRWAYSSGEASQLKSDEQVILFSTAANLRDDGAAWIVPIHGWVFEAEQKNLLQRAALSQLRRVLGLDSEEPDSETFKQRARAFLVDNERGKRIRIQTAGQDVAMEASDPGGHFLGTIVVPIESAGQLTPRDQLVVEAVTRPRDLREFTGVVHLIEPTGISVISDVDDTIKVSEVRNKKKLIDNTFCKPFRAVDGMADTYRRWADAGAKFHFVSSSPWQLYEPLMRFLEDNGFPAGSFHLKRFRLKDRTALDLLADPLTTKPRVIESLLRAYPLRRFVLVGDSGEQDPEVYALIARQYNKQILRIFIRDVTDEPADSPRYQECFRDLPTDLWHVFDDPRSLSVPWEDKK